MKKQGVTWVDETGAQSGQSRKEKIVIVIADCHCNWISCQSSEASHLISDFGLKLQLFIRIEDQMCNLR